MQKLLFFTASLPCKTFSQFSAYKKQVVFSKWNILKGDNVIMIAGYNNNLLSHFKKRQGQKGSRNQGFQKAKYGFGQGRQFEIKTFGLHAGWRGQRNQADQ
jgi:hypothetical protein